MESDEGFRLVLFFQGLVLYHGFSNRSRRFDSFDYSRSGGSSSSGGCLSFLAATTHFTWIVRRTAVFAQGAGRSSFNHGCFNFSNNRGFNSHWCRLGNHDFNHRCWRFLYNRRRRGSFDRGGRFGSPLEGGLFFANFTHRWGSFFDSRSFNYGFNHWLRFNNRRRFNGDRFGFWLGVANRGYFHFRNHWGFDRGSCLNSGGLNDRCFNRWGLGNWCFYSSGFFNGCSSAFSLLVSLGFSRSADDRAGNGSSNGQAGSQFGTRRFVSFVGCALSVLAGLFRAFDYVAVGITLALATVAATTLTTGAAARTIAFGAVLTIFLQLLFAGQSASSSSLAEAACSARG